MRCPSCGREADANAQFCTFCGSPLQPLPEPGEGAPTSDVGQPSAVEEQLRLLQRTTTSIQAELSRHSLRLAELDRLVFPSVFSGRGAPASAEPPPATPEVPPVAQPAGVLSQSTEAPLAPRAPVAREDAAPVAAEAPPPPSGPGLLDTLAGRDWEWLLGGNWLARIGVAALVIGVGFFLQLAFANNWIGSTGRVALGLVGGVAFLGAGEYWQRKYPIWAQPVTGGGIAILYLSIFAAFSLYQLIPPLPALGLFFLVTVTAAGLALRYEAVAIAVLGILGGFLTPVMLREQLPDSRLLLAYVLVLDLGVLGLATFRNWRWFTLLGLLGSLGLFGFWWVELEPSLRLA